MNAQSRASDELTKEEEPMDLLNLPSKVDLLRAISEYDEKIRRNESLRDNLTRQVELQEARQKEQLLRLSQQESAKLKNDPDSPTNRQPTSPPSKPREYKSLNEQVYFENRQKSARSQQFLARLGTL